MKKIQNIFIAPADYYDYFMWRLSHQFYASLVGLTALMYYGMPILRDWLHG